MIKKMMAMLVAISCAFGAWADTHISGTDFSTHPVGTFETQHDDAGNPIDVDHHTYWYNGDTSDVEGTIVLGTNETDHVLDFESNITNPLYRTISICDNAASPASFTPTPIGTGLFIDTHVQFTPYLVNENHPAPTGSGEDKLIVWVRETEVDGDANLTNLIITAGYIAQNGNVSSSNYVANLTQAQASALCDGQHRLTIKSYQNITAHSGVTVMGFVVYVDETVVEYIGDAFADGSVFLPLVPGPAQYYSQGGGHNKLLPCLMDYGTDPSTIDSYSKLTAVGYAGMGKIGDVIFDSYNTTYPAFAGDDLAFQVVLGDGVTSFDYLGETYETNASFTVDATTASVTISNVLYNTTAGYTHKTGTWHNNVPVDNQVGAGGDYGTFYFANGTILTLVGFQANYIVNGDEFDTLLGENGALAAALDGGYPLVLNNDVEINEGDGCLYLGSDDTLVLDLKGHTIKGTGDEYTPTIINNGGTLTIVDTSSNQDGKVLNNDNSNLCLGSYSGSTTTLNAGIYEEVDDLDGDLTTITINGGTYRDNVYGPSSFYMSSRIADDKEIVDWITDGDDNYAVIGEPSGDTWDITFSTNNVVVTEWNLTVNDGSPIGNHIPNFTGGLWDAPAPTAETIVTSDTNFNYTVTPPVDPWEPTDHSETAVSNKVASIFGDAVAQKVNTYDDYTNMVHYLESKGATDPDDFKSGGIYETAAPYVYQSYILGADALFTDVPKVTVTDVAANATAAGKWDFTVKVSQGASATALAVDKDKLAALALISGSLSPATWVAPTAGNISAEGDDTTHLVTVTINYGEAGSGFMKVSE